MKKLITATFLILLSMPSYAVILVQTSDAGFYNDSIGTSLNLSNTGVDDANAYFPILNDSNTSFPIAPDLSAADSVLGDWLTDPLGTIASNPNWTFESSIPNSWAINSEVAIMYQFNTLQATNVVASFGVDNGIFAWLNGQYLGGSRNAGGSNLGEYLFNIGDLSAGTYFLQLLLEDHGSANGYAVNITADQFVQGPPPNPNAPIPSPLPLSLIAIGMIALGLSKRKA